jgi:large subunit ribosomal protein L15
VGFHKHKWTYTVKYDPDRFAKHGFKPYKRKEVITINVGKLDEQIDTLSESKQAKKTKNGIKVHLNSLGYDKLLAKGQITHPLIVQVDSWTKSAAKKIEEAGGKVLKPE